MKVQKITALLIAVLIMTIVPLSALSSCRDRSDGAIDIMTSDGTNEPPLTEGAATDGKRPGETNAADLPTEGVTDENADTAETVTSPGTDPADITTRTPETVHTSETTSTPETTHKPDATTTHKPDATTTHKPETTTRKPETTTTHKPETTTTRKPDATTTHAPETTRRDEVTTAPQAEAHVHNFVKVSETVETEKGVTTITTVYECSCGASYTETHVTVGDDEHHYVVTDEKASTCTEEGYITYTCVDCGATYTMKLQKADHTFASKVDREPTPSSAGRRTKTCSVCGFSTTEWFRNPGDALVEAELTKGLWAMKSEYPEGRPWTNDNVYVWNALPGTVYNGYGCAAFAFILSDSVFGDLPAREVTGVKFENIRVGDIIRINGDTHSVIVLEVESDGVIIAEGNFNSSIHWGRKLSRAEVEKGDYIFTRYPN